MGAGLIVGRQGETDALFLQPSERILRRKGRFLVVADSSKTFSWAGRVGNHGNINSFGLRSGRLRSRLAYERLWGVFSKNREQLLERREGWSFWAGGRKLRGRHSTRFANRRAISGLRRRPASNRTPVPDRFCSFGYGSARGCLGNYATERRAICEGSLRPWHLEGRCK